MSKHITQKRLGDRIAFLNERGSEIASLFDHHKHIIFDHFADTLDVLDNTSEQYRDLFDGIGLDVQTARQIDAMPIPDRTL